MVVSVSVSVSVPVVSVVEELLDDDDDDELEVSTNVVDDSVVSSVVVELEEDDVSTIIVVMGVSVIEEDESVRSPVVSVPELDVVDGSIVVDDVVIVAVVPGPDVVVSLGGSPQSPMHSAGCTHPAGSSATARIQRLICRGSRA